MNKYLNYLYPEIEPYEKNFLQVDEIHQIYYEISGNKNGIPILFIHGGPGGATSAYCRRYFDPKYYKIVLFDQRGCGLSKPSLELKNNTTQNLVQDIELLRKHLKIKQFILFGGSWGTTLGLIYAINYPRNVKALVLRGIYLSRQKDIEWLYQEGASYFKPLEYEQYVSLLDKKQRKNIVKSYWELMNSNDLNLRNKALIEWARWENSLISLSKNKFNEKEIKKNSEIALLENYYFVNNTFIEENYILNNIHKIKDIKTFIVHGEYDLDCRPSGAYELSKKLNNCELFFIPKSGHSQKEWRISKKLVEITNLLINEK
ncbi:Proline iminopeptidase [Mycoplasmopsis meleagridis]|uniref:Proline iminopeptidase n=1 Tax=Mycoplasmopsis meleagridis ATCC 25294 TaxID=1264554 RepID=A0A0F5H171_9BACT|nr:prolyl aminopeptidase [Mycoplasmopsis meleagridis]KKB26900.1 Proline iminopeptidase [Mycoplasmopsis meleagridis ATCC 25294]OAD18270.1 Proline iminopeptidase [Mycoplasmopsis meleagridis]VEU77556.1 Proline iminopeptidase [Mycoplasmopsis meleagridis]